MEIVKVSDAGRHSIVETRLDGTRIMLLVNDGEAVPSEAPCLKFDPDHTQVYADGWMIA